MSVSVADILDSLVARSAVPSTLGTQLQRMQEGIYTPPDPHRARDEAENEMISKAELLRCISGFTARNDFDAGYGTLEKIQKNCRLPQGYIAINILRMYQERCPCQQSSQEMGLAAVYRYIAGLAPKAVPSLPSSETDLLQAFRTGKAPRARSMAGEAYADSLLSLQGYVQKWNRGQRHAIDKGDTSGGETQDKPPHSRGVVRSRPKAGHTKGS